MSTRWVTRRPEYYVQTGGMHENPYGVPKDEIVRMILENPAEVVAQVVFGKYVESSGLVFTGELIQTMIDRACKRVQGNFYVDKDATRQAAIMFERLGFFGNRYHTGVDVARQTDYTVITTIDTATLPARVVYWKRLNRVPWETIYTEIGHAVRLWGENVLVDSTGMGGDVVMDALESRLYCKKHRCTFLINSRCLDRDGSPRDCEVDDYLSLGCCDGYGFTQGTKRQLVEHLRNVMSVGYDAREIGRDFGWLRTPPIVVVEEELSFYSWEDKKLQTDALFSLALATWSGLEDPVGDASVGGVFGT